MPSDSAHAVYGSLNYPQAVYNFYSSRSFDFAWTGNNSYALTDSLLSFIKSARVHGLLPRDYHADEFKKRENDTSFYYRKEVLLTDAFLSLANDLKYGRLPSTEDSSKDSLNLVSLENALKYNQVKKVLRNQEPVHQGYLDLKESLWELLSAADSSNAQLLYAGITIDSIDLHKSVQQIEINMERWRLEMTDLKQRYIWINIPSYQLQVIDNGRLVLDSRIIVGKPESPTPVLSSMIECITLFPYWFVPRKIAVEEYLPEIKKDTAFLTRNNFDVLDRKGNMLDPATLEWEKFTSKYFPVSLRQREGPDNSLGVIKFIFDNPNAVFLHDTNVKSLFNRKARMFSHGCIRMEKALELAKYLAGDSGIIESKLQLKKRHTINLVHAIPIYTRYFTCERINGELIFYDDIYQLDQPLIDLLYNQRHCHATD